jgi:hypothetical protein
MEPPDEWDGNFNTFPLMITWKRKFVIVPHRSKISGKHIWLKYARYCVLMPRPDLGVLIHEWMTEEEYIVEKLKGNA